MIKFTKEDYLCLHNAIDIQVKTVPMSELNVKRRRELLTKLEFVIDNYCEHPEIYSASIPKCMKWGTFI